MTTKKVLGLDIGLSSIGWAIVELKESEDAKSPTREFAFESGKILDAGARIFPAAEQSGKQAGESPAKPRREARSQRRRSGRRAARLLQIRRLLVRRGALPREVLRIDESGRKSIDEEKIARLHSRQNESENAWRLRVEGLDRQLAPREWAVVLTHLAKRRGYRSNRKEEAAIEADKSEEAEEKKKVLAAVGANKKPLEDGRYRTVAEMMTLDPRFARGDKQVMRNRRRDGKPHYGGVVAREWIEKEIKALFAAQREKGNALADAGLESEYLAIWGRQLPFDRGHIAEMVGDCAFEAGERRAPRESFSAEYARLLQDINHRLHIRRANGDKVPAAAVAANACDAIFALARRKEAITFADLRRELSLGAGHRFVGVFYSAEEKRFEKKVEHLHFLVAEETAKECASLARDGGEVSRKQIADFLRLPDSVELPTKKGARDDGVFWSPQKKDAKIEENFGKAMLGLRLAPTQNARREIVAAGLDAAQAGRAFSRAEIRAALALPESIVFARKESDEQAAFFEFAQTDKLRRAIVDGLGESRWLSLSPLEKGTALDAARFGRDAADKREFLAAKNIDADWVAVVADLKIADKSEADEKFLGMPGWHKVKNAFAKNGKVQWRDGEAVWNRLAKAAVGDDDAIRALDTIVETAAWFRTDDGIAKRLSDGLPASFADCAEIVKRAIYKISTSEPSKLSLKALRKITPHLQAGLTYDKACGEAGYNHAKPGGETERDKKLPPDAVPSLGIRNPRVVRALAQTRKVVNAAIEKHGSFHRVHIELLRDLARSPRDRFEIKKGQDAFRDAKEADLSLFREIYRRDPKGDDLLKFRLAKWQNEQSPYSGERFDMARLLEAGYVEIDHILPFSRSLDDSRTNKALCFTAENREKGDSIPFEWFGEDEARWRGFEERVKNRLIGWREKFLRRKFGRDEAIEHREKWVEQAESKWIAREMKNLLERRLLFAPSGDRIKIQTRNGAFTGFLRARWGLHKDREDDLHHAIDAMVLAVSTQGMVQRVMTMSKAGEIWAAGGDAAETTDEATGEIVKTKYSDGKNKPPFIRPWPGFRDDALAQKSKIFVSRPPVCRMTGEAHAATIVKIEDEKGAEGKSAQQQRAELAREGSLVRGGKPKEWKILRVDVFENGGEFYLSAVRPYHRVRGELPTELISKRANAPRIDDSYAFKFSLFPGDAVWLRAKKSKMLEERFPPTESHAGVRWNDDGKTVDIIGYYRKTHATDARITVQAHDSSWGKDGKFCPGAQGLLAIEKLAIPILGGVDLSEIIDKKRFVVREKTRRELAKPRNRKPRRP